MNERIETGEPERRPSGRRTAAEEPIEVRRYLDALRRSLPLVIGIVVVLAAATYIVSTSLPKRYKATTSIVQRTNAALDTSSSVDTIARDLNTINSLLTTDDVLNGATRQLPNETLDTLRDKVSSSVDPNANLIYVTAKDASPQESARISNAVASTFVSEQADIQRRQYEHALADLQDELNNITGQGASTADQEQAIRDRIAQLRVSIATAGSDLGVAQRADAPKTQNTPRPLRNTALAIVLGLFLGVLVALGRDQLVPRVSGSRELSRLLELPVLVSVPYVNNRRGRRSRALTGIEYETYQTLATSIRFSLTPAEGPHVVLVTSALHAEGKSTVTMRLGRALAHAGHRTLLISADMRWPTLHDLVEVPLGPGLADLLQSPPADPRDARGSVVDRIHHAPGRRRGVLDVLPSGRKPSDPTELLADVSLDQVFDAVQDLDYTYVLIDAPPLLGIADTQALARRATSILYVARLDRITLENVVDAREILDRIDRPAAGMVVIGARSEASPYYLSS